MRLGEKRLSSGWRLAFCLVCLLGLSAGSSPARVLESTNGPRLTVGPSGHAYTKEELAKQQAGKSHGKKKRASSESGPKETLGKE